MPSAEGVYVADFETTDNGLDAWVWLWCVTDIGCQSFTYGLSIESFIDYTSANPGVYYFHNLAFDASYLLSCLLSNGYVYVDGFEPKDNEITTLISAQGKFYMVSYNIGGCVVRMQDSLKKLPMSAAEVAKAYDLPLSKGSIDYDKVRPKGYKPSADEVDYVRNDVEIIARALMVQFSEGLEAMTAGSDALKDFKSICPSWEKLYPRLPFDVDAFCRRSYKGGYTYCNPKYKGMVVGAGLVYDVVSLYPSIMYYEPLPFGNPIIYSGRYVANDAYPLYIQMLIADFHLKPGHLPTVQIKGNPYFVETEYVIESFGYVELTMTNVDLDLFLEHYDVDVLEWWGGLAFKANQGEIFKAYIDKWMEVKARNMGGKRTIAKLMLNSLYGKFGKNPNVTTKRPELDGDGILRYTINPQEIGEAFYVPLASFVTSYGRAKTIKAAQAVFDRYLYSDTDSIHILGDKPDGLDVGKGLGQWDLEYAFLEAKYIRAKAYIEIVKDEGRLPHAVVKCAGMPSNVKKDVTMTSFRTGAVFNGKLVPRMHRGGIVLKPTTFTII